MKVILISPYPDLTSFGLRTLSACLKQAGHETRLVFLRLPLRHDIGATGPLYSEAALEDTVALCRDADLVGISLMSSFLPAAIEITTALRQANRAPIVWGGVHPTVCPEDCLNHADIVCIGEGEDALLALVDRIENRLDYTDIQGLWVRRAGTVIRNPLGVLSQDLDQYPLPDYDLSTQYILDDGRVVPLTHDLFRVAMDAHLPSEGAIQGAYYQTMTGRGCPHSCTYCINDFMKKLYNGHSYLRWRSVGHLMDELRWVRINMPYVNLILISDDAFMARPVKDLREFGLRYSQEVNLPFACLASPLTVTDEKMQILTAACMFQVQMGIESASPRILDIFNRRKISVERVQEAIRIISKYKDKTIPVYDFIFDVPTETDQDRIQSLRLIADIPKPYRINIFSLVLFPGTSLYDRAKQEGSIDNENLSSYRRIIGLQAPDYLGILALLARKGRINSTLFKLLLSQPLPALLNSNPMKLFWQFIWSARKKVRTLRRG